MTFITAKKDSVFFQGFDIFAALTRVDAHSCPEKITPTVDVRLFLGHGISVVSTGLLHQIKFCGVFERGCNFYTCEYGRHPQLQ